MRKQSVVMKSLLPCAMILAGISALASMAGATRDSGIHGQKRSSENLKEHIDLPVVDYGAEQSVDRATKGRRYNRPDARVVDDEDTQPLPLISHWSWGMAPFPTEHSDAVVIASIADAQAYLSEDKRDVYSEFAVRIEVVLGSTRTLRVTEGESLIAQRTGGAVRFPSGRIRYFRIQDQRMPRVGHRYLLFLKLNNADGSFSIVTGYELRNGEVSPLDRAEVFSTYEGYPETECLDAVRAAIANPSSRLHDKETRKQ